MAFSDQPPGNAARRSVVETALFGYRAETERYLLSYTSWPLTNPYDQTCCDTCRRERVRWETGEVTRRALIERLDAINDALTEVGADA